MFDALAMPKAKHAMGGCIADTVSSCDAILTVQ